MLSVVLIDDDTGSVPIVRNGGDGLQIEFEGTITVTETDGRTHREHACQKWTFSTDAGFLLTINFGNERQPRVSYAGTNKTPASHIGEAIASAIRATSSPSSTHEGPEAP